MDEKAEVLNLEEAISFRDKSVLSQVLGNGAVEATLFCMAAGTAISEHTTSRHARVLVLKGRGVFHLPDREVAMTPGVMISLPPGMKHSLAAGEDTAFILFQA